MSQATHDSSRGEPIRVLHLEDDPVDSQLVAEILSSEGIPVELERVDDLEAFRAALERGGHALIFSDYTIPGVDAFEALRLGLERRPEVPYIFVSGTLGEENAVEALKQGATNYVLKQRLDRLVPAVRQALKDVENRRRREEAEAAARQKAAELALTAERLSLAQRAGRVGVFDWDLTTQDIYWTPELEAMLGVESAPPKEQYAHWARRVDPEDLARIEKLFSDWLTSPRDEAYWEYRIDRHGEQRWIESRGRLVRDATGRPVRMIGTNLDITERVRAQEAIRQRVEELETIMDVAPVAIWVARDPACHHVVGNETAFRMHRARPGENLSSTPPPGVSPARRYFVEGREVPGFEMPMQRAAALAVEIRDAEFEVEMPDGERRTFYGSARPLTGAGGAVRGSVGAFVDITERKRVDEQVRVNAQRFQAIFENVALGIVEVGPDGRLVSVNDRLCQMLGYSREELLGRTVSDITAPASKALSLERNAQIAEGRSENIDYEKEYLKRDGTSLWVHVIVSAVRDSAGGLARTIGTVEDISERKRAEFELASAKSRLEVILGSLPAGVIIADGEGRLVDANQQAVALWAGPPMQIPPSEYGMYRGFWPRTGRQLKAEEWALARAVTTGEVVTGQEVDIERFDGTAASVLCNAAPFRDPDGRISGGVVVMLDISERRRSEEAVHAALDNAELERKRLAAVLDALPIAVAIADTEGRIVQHNAAYLELWGNPPSASSVADSHQWRGWWTETGEPLAADDWAMARALRTGEVVSGDIVDIEQFGGGRLTIVNSAAPIRDAHGAIVGGVVAEVDITAQRRAEEAVRDADRRKSEFLAMLSHELRNPLAPIRNGLYLLERAEPHGPQAKRARDVIGRQVLHLTRLIDDLLDVTRISRGKIRLQRQRVDLCGLVRRTAEDHRSMFTAGEVEFAVSMCSEELWAEVDPTRVAQVIGNLLGNAAKFTPRGGRVELSLASEGETVAVRVRDNGAGIAPDLLKKLFEPFVQADATLDRSQGGLGLGLALVKGLTELHGGSVIAHSAGPGTGAEFVVRLPRADADAAARASGYAAGSEPVREPAPEPAREPRA